MSATTLCTWEATSALFAGAYLNGGPASVVYGFIVSVLGTLCIAGSFAEMASMYVFGDRFPQNWILTIVSNLAHQSLEPNIIGALNIHPSNGVPSSAMSKAGLPLLAG